ncbi:hypothetical protein H072_8035 [Dactylellina haptotyla CBS 200.50]|uniref:Carboxylic ester hydrolase n=1 Tax=Dactylellina haptotyla (strain CBS 200.50) TaxID=1284197 RepID=S8A5U1_DACHA|nr:hypothetical protein H072_8035 [Dactylellina haptotyla CBS 200.50]
MKSSLILSFSLPIALQFVSGASALPPNYVPSAQAKNGTVYGIYSLEYNQDYFLGIPYAQPPVDDLRFRPPQSLNTQKTVNAKAYGKWCYGPGGDSVGQDMSEDCLTLNIIRPANIKPNAKLPVAVWIHGGGFSGGSGADRRYNLTYLVEQSVAMGTPIIGVSINYRLSIWGWLGGREVIGSGNSNLGFRDQRLALRWIQENIKAFGGDKSKVTLFGESAGAISIAWHQIAYGGRNDRLFSGAIMQSGSAMYEPQWWPETYQPKFDSLVNATGCLEAVDRLQCLRTADINDLWQFAQENSGTTDATIDGDILTEYSSKLLQDGKFVKVPTIIGANTDEGTAFGPFGDTAANNESELKNRIQALLNGRLTDNMLDELMTVYDSSASIPAPENYTGTDIPWSFLGTEFFRGAAIVGDLEMHAPKRYTAEQFTAHNSAIWTYRFNCIPYQYPLYVAVTHFAEVAFVFYSRNQDFGDGFSSVNPMGGPDRQLYIGLSDIMSKAWIKFFKYGNPNGNTGATSGGSLYWPSYGEGPGAQQIVFDKGPGNTFIEKDDYRAAGISWINQHRLIIGR